jgi:hypothetical protein
MPAKIADLIIHDPHQSRKAGDVFVESLPENPEKNLVVLIEIDSNRPEDAQFIEQFINLAYSAFEKAKLMTAEKTLENILYQLNDAIPQFLPRSRRWLEQFHCLVAVFEQGFLHFSTFGKIKIFLIKPTSIKNIGAKAEEAVNKIFSFTLNGEIKHEDKILITTENLINYLSLEKIKKTIATLPPKSAVAHINNILQSTPPEVSFFSIVLQNDYQPESEKEQEIPLLIKLRTPKTSKNSLDQLITVEKETEKILTPPSFWLLFKAGLKKKNLFGWLNKNNLSKLIILLTAGSKKIKQFILWLIIKLKTIWPYLKSFSKLKELLISWWRNLIQFFQGLSKKNKILIGVLVVFLLVFSQNLIWKSRQQTKIKNEQQYQQLLTDIENKGNGIEAALIYNDTFRAKQLLAEVKQLAQKLPNEIKNKNPNKDEIAQKIEALNQRVWKIDNLNDPAVLADFQSADTAINLKNIVVNNKSLMAFGDNNQIFNVNLDNRKIESLAEANLTLFNPRLLNAKGQVIAQNAQNKFYTFNGTKTQEMLAKLPTTLKQIDDFNLYVDKLYLLDRGSNQIYRLINSGKTFVSPKSWITDKTSVANGVSLAIDGLVYVLTDNGQIIRFSSGKKDDLPQISIDPALTSGQKIFTNVDSKNLYILDKANKRLISLNKAAELQKQYYSDKFDDLKDVFVNEKDKKIYLLNGNKIFLIPL